MNAVTPEDIIKVRRHECALRGHTWNVIEAVGIGPTHVICDNCGESHTVDRQA